jgi:hypothetical protein
MQINVTDLAKEIVYNARLGQQNMKVVEVIEKLDDARMEFLQITFVSQFGEYHKEKFYPDRHAKKLLMLARSFNEGEYRDGKEVIIDTTDFVGNYFNCRLVAPPLSDGQVSDTKYIRDVRVCPLRKDQSGSWNFKKNRRKKS